MSHKSKLIHYVWIGPKPLPDKYRQRLKKANYPFKLHLNCDMIIDRHEKRLGTKFKYAQTIIMRADLCRLLIIIDEGGMYSDLDVNITDYPCLQKLMDQHEHFFTLANKGKPGPENFLFYESKPGSPRLQKIVQGWDVDRELDQDWDTSMVNVVAETHDCMVHTRDENWREPIPVPSDSSVPVWYWVLPILILVGILVWIIKRRSRRNKNSQLDQKGTEVILEETA